MSTAPVIDTDQPVEATPELQSGVKSDAEKSPDELFKWSMWVNVGDGAEECPEARSGRCRERGHFHAWIRLPNPFQIRDITEKASAARARRHRMMRDADSDARVILEDELDVLRDGEKSILVEEILDEDFAENYTRAVRDVDQLDDPDFVPEGDEPMRKLFAGIDQDREEYERQRDLPEDQRTEDFPQMEKTLADYSRAIDDALKRITEPRREHLMERDMDDLVKIVRNKRIEEQGNEAYLHWFNTWQWFVCTFKPAGEKQPHERVWSDINQMRLMSDTGVILAIKDGFSELESNLARTRLGKGV